MEIKISWLTDFWRWLGTIGPGPVAETRRLHQDLESALPDDHDFEMLEWEAAKHAALLVERENRVIGGPPPLVETETYSERQERLLVMAQRHELERKRDDELRANHLASTRI